MKSNLSNLARRSYLYKQHVLRYKNTAWNRKPRLVCQDCCGEGGYYERIDPDVGGPWESCDLCRGGGYLVAHDRGLWLRYAKEKSQGRKKGS